MTDFFQRCDALLMRRVFHPIAWTVDARWHKNQFFLASVFVVLAMLVLGIQAAGDLLLMQSWFKLLAIFCLGINLFLYQGWLTRFQRAEKWQEDHPGILCLPHHSFMFFPGEFRFLGMMFGLIMFATLVTLGTVIDALPGVWLMLLECAICFAGVIPPDRGARVEKKEKALASRLSLAPSLVPHLRG